MNESELILTLSSNLFRSSDGGTSFLHKLLLTNRHALNIRKAFASNPLTDIMLSRPQSPKMIQSVGFLGRLLGLLLKTGLPLLNH